MAICQSNDSGKKSVLQNQFSIFKNDCSHPDQSREPLANQFRESGNYTMRRRDFQVRSLNKECDVLTRAYPSKVGPSLKKTCSAILGRDTSEENPASTNICTQTINMLWYIDDQETRFHLTNMPPTWVIPIAWSAPLKSEEGQWYKERLLPWSSWNIEVSIIE